MQTEKKTKIVATIGPVTANQEKMTEIIKAGVNVIRLNFSHGDFAEHQIKVDLAKKISTELNIPVAILQDLGGPKIRTGDFATENGTINLIKGENFTLTTESVEGSQEKVSINYPNLPKEVSRESKILLDDGKIELLVKEIKEKEVICEVIIGGTIKGKRGVNIPNCDLSISCLSEKDKNDIEFGIKNEVDFIALSFVRYPSDIVELKKILEEKKSKASIVAKIETIQAVKNLDEIIRQADVIMVARGDLAIEVSPEEVPLIQKRIISKCNALGKPVITATQMLESMVNLPVPTRAEVNDVANAILDGTDAIMLSNETTIGQFPLQAVEVMVRIAKKTENDSLHKQLLCKYEDPLFEGIGNSVATSAVDIADKINAKFIVSITGTGRTARLISRNRPTQPILVFSPNQEAYQKSILVFGCWVFKLKECQTIEEAMEEIEKILKTKKMIKKDDKIVIATSMPFGKAVDTNVLIVETVS